MELDVIRREGTRLIKYKKNVADTEHLFCYKHKGLYYVFNMKGGILVDHNNREISNTDLCGTKGRGKYFKEYYNSTLNQWYKD